ncbi:hypothetical protein BJX64DRAFT_287500 [Aspergillus heterothallicus]
MSSTTATILEPYIPPSPTKEDCFFYVTNHGLSPIQINRQYAIAQALFSLPLSEKLKYLCNTAAGDFRGYKPQSTGKLGIHDNDERYNIPKFTREHEEGRDHPQVIWDHYAEIKEFSLHIHDNILVPLLRLFAFILELEDGEDALVDRHRYEEPGLEYLRYMVYHPRSEAEDHRAGNLWAKGHTDYNTLTFLFHQPVAGLQVLGPDGQQWRYVRSEDPGKLIVNIGDALEYLSGGFLKSTVHRVVRPPGDQVGVDRYSLIYFARPEARVRMEPLESPMLKRVGVSLDEEYVRALQGVTAEEWARARIAKDHRLRAGVVDKPETEIIAGVPQKYYD